MSDLWAKSPDTPGVPPITLFRHSVDVTRQMAEYHRLYQPIWPIPEGPVCLPRVLAYAALVHDFGKVHPGFQAALRENGPRFGNRHEVLSLVFLSGLDIPTNERPWIEAAIALHHKNLSRLVGASQPFYLGEVFGCDGTKPKRLVDGLVPARVELLWELLRHSERIFREAGWTNIDCFEVQPQRAAQPLARMRESLRRLTDLSRRFQADHDDFGGFLSPLPWPLRRAGVTVRGFILSADHLASFRPHSLRIGLEELGSTRATLAANLPEFQNFNSHQDSAAQQNGNCVLVAPTGAGKTEAALLWAARQAEGGLKGRTYFLLPYQASMNAMQRRLVKDFAPSVLDQPEKWESEVALVHSRSMRAAYERLLDRNYSPSEAQTDARLQGDLARLNVAPIRVCSPFQLVHLLFAPKGVEGLLLALSEARLIFDEIHAYDPQVTAMALTALRFVVQQFGSRVFFMTATLPSHLREALTRLFGVIPVLRPGSDVLSQPPRHRLNLLAPDVQVLSKFSIEAIQDAASRGSVLVVVNQVRRARELCKSLNHDRRNVHLLHSRFTHKDRAQKEKEIEPVGGSILVATQAVEVSLDLDYDTCFSELAPLESLLQRFGRCNRRGKRAGPATVNVYRTFPDTGRQPHLPYREDHLQTTRRALEAFVAAGSSGLLREDRIQTLLDSSYPEVLKQEMTSQIETKIEQLNEHFVEPFAPFGMQDEGVTRTLDRQWQELFDGEEVLPVSFRAAALKETSWLGRARYFVPISGRKFHQLWRQQKIRWDDELMCNVVEAAYTQEGLDV
jgi:CRISPR-associated endonuclease/helicase Cas3